MPGAPHGLCSALVLATAVTLTLGLRRQLGLVRALAIGLAGPMISTSALGLLLLDVQRVRWSWLLAGLLLMSTLWLAALPRLRALAGAPDAVDEPRPTGRARTLTLTLAVALTLTIAVGTTLRGAPSPYLQGGQDQGIYVNVGHHIARTGRLRPVDALMAGRVPGVRPTDIRRAHKIRARGPDSPMTGNREGRWLAGIHVEDARAGRLVPAFFHLLPVWFALAELDLGFARSTWPLTLFAALSLLAAAGASARAAKLLGLAPRGRAVAAVAAALALALHPLDLWMSSFPVSENLARACLLGAAYLSLESQCSGREPVARLLGGLAGVAFALGVFTRGSMLALALALGLGLLLARPSSRARAAGQRALYDALVVGTTLATVHAITQSWPYFFHAAHRHFAIPNLTPPKGLAATCAAASGLVALGLARWLDRVRATRPRVDAVGERALRVLSAAALAAGLALAMIHVIAPPEGYTRAQQLAVALARHGGWMLPLGGGAALFAAAWRAPRALLPWALLAALIVLSAARGPGIRYEFYYARYLVGDLVPALALALACLLGHIASKIPRPVPGLAVAALLTGAWTLPPLAALRAPVYWTRDLADDPAQLTRLFEQVPAGAVLLFDARAPHRFRDLLATPALLSFGRDVLVYPDARLVERMIDAGTSVYMLSGGWEAADHQRWPRADHGPLHTTVVARGFYHALRAETAEGRAPTSMVERGGPWELHRVDPSIWRGHGAFSLYPGSRFLARDDARALVSETLPLRWVAGARLELHTTANCPAEARLELDAPAHPIELPALPPERPDVRLWAMPPPPASAREPVRGRLHVRFRCDGASPGWRRLGVRWDRER